MHSKFLKISTGILIFIILFLIFYDNPALNLIENNCVTNKIEKEVRGNSMEPLIVVGETFVLLEGYYNCNEVVRGDVIAYDYRGNDNPLIKRVLVMANDGLEFKGNTLLVNNEILKNSNNQVYVFPEKQKKFISLYIKNEKLVEEAYLIFGDNVNDSLDSRKFGAVSDKDFVGKFVV